MTAVLRQAAGFIAAALFAGCATTRTQETPTGPAVSLLTWNVDWQARDRMQIVHTLRATDADIVCLQETDRAWALLLRSERGLGKNAAAERWRSMAERIAHRTNAAAWQGWPPTFISNQKSTVGNARVQPVWSWLRQVGERTRGHALA